MSTPQLHLIPFVLPKPATVQELTAEQLSMYVFVVGGDFQALLTFQKKSQGMPLALSLIALTSVSPVVEIILIHRFAAGG